MVQTLTSMCTCWEARARLMYKLQGPQHAIFAGELLSTCQSEHDLDVTTDKCREKGCLGGRERGSLMTSARHKHCNMAVNRTTGLEQHSRKQ